MACLRLTLIRPRPGMTLEAQTVIQELDECFAGAEGLLLSLVMHRQPETLGRVAIWKSKEMANHAATREHVLALRARLRSVSLETEEVLMDVRSGQAAHALDTLVTSALGLETRIAGKEVA